MAVTLRLTISTDCCLVFVFCIALSHCLLLSKPKLHIAIAISVRWWLPIWTTYNTHRLNVRLLAMILIASFFVLDEYCIWQSIYECMLNMVINMCFALWRLAIKKNSRESQLSCVTAHYTQLTDQSHERNKLYLIFPMKIISLMWLIHSMIHSPPFMSCGQCWLLTQFICDYVCKFSTL